MILIANWKMQLGAKESGQVAKQIAQELPKHELGAEIVIAPSFPALSFVADAIKKSSIKLGAQDCFWQNKGAFTGEVSPTQLREFGCTHAIVGHSERRAMEESDEHISRKVRALVLEGMTPILCVGETGEERRLGQVQMVLERQLRAALTDLRLPGSSRLVIAYEPVWAIGTGDAAGPSDAAGALATIQMVLKDAMKPSDLEKVSVVYGGSVDSGNIASFIRVGFSGSLVGGASLSAKQFVGIVKEAVASL